LKLKHDNPLSNFACIGFKCKLRQYATGLLDISSGVGLVVYMVGLYSLTASNPVLKAPLVSALETAIS